MQTKAEKSFKLLESLAATVAIYKLIKGGWRGTKIEMNIRPSSEHDSHRGCRSVVVTGKRGHCVYHSRDDVVQKSRGCPSFVPQGSLHPTAVSRCIGCTGGYIRRERGVSISWSRTHPEIALVILSSHDAWKDRSTSKCKSEMSNI